MNREIKIRAWIIKEDDMIDVTAIDFTPDKENPHGWIACSWEQGFNESIDTHERDCVFKMEDVILMQYTELKDKNGKPIFEGDYLFEIEGIDDPIDNYYLVEYINGAFRHTGEEGEPTGDWDLTKYEVRGNLYEKPEILEKANQ